MIGHKTAYDRTERGQGGMAGDNACGITVQSVGHGFSTIGLGLGHFGAEHTRCEVTRIEAMGIAKRLYASLLRGVPSKGHRGGRRV